MAAIEHDPEPVPATNQVTKIFENKYVVLGEILEAKPHEGLGKIL
jgi:hypothetical protein